MLSSSESEDVPSSPIFPRKQSSIFTASLPTTQTEAFAVVTSPDRGSVETVQKNWADRPVFKTPPATEKWLDIIKWLVRQEQPSAYLNRDVVFDLAEDVTAVLKEETTLLQVELGSEDDADKLIVVGDIHGQLNDFIYHVLSLQLDAVQDRRFLFLGDFVDRGPHGVEVIMLLLALKVTYPDRIFLLRGNHEDAQTSRIYGFLQEVRTKFGDLSVWAKFNEVFRWFPAAAIVVAGHRKMLAVHGGLSPSLVTLDQIRSIRRDEYGASMDFESTQIMDGLLWSDPTEAHADYQRNERGCGFTFGTTAVDNFCARNSIDFICRAHQVVMAGYGWGLNGRVLTVFSAPNYCNVANNMAAVLVLDGTWNLEFVQFSPAPVASRAEGTYTPSMMSYF